MDSGAASFADWLHSNARMPPNQQKRTLAGQVEDEETLDEGVQRPSAPTGERCTAERSSKRARETSTRKTLTLVEMLGTCERGYAKQLIRAKGLDLCYIPAFMGAGRATKLQRDLLSRVPWYRVEYRNFLGHLVTTPRFTSTFLRRPSPAGRTDDSSPYPTPPAPPSFLAELWRSVEEAAGAAFDVVLLNLYQNNRDSIAFHADDEEILGPLPIIASLSVGAEREFVLRRKDAHLEKRRVVLVHGSLLVMRGETQKHWEHSIPARAAPCGLRINLTFRKLVRPDNSNQYGRFGIGSGPAFLWNGSAMARCDGANSFMQRLPDSPNAQN